MVEPLRHRQTKGAETDMPGLPPPRHFPTLPNSAGSPAGRQGRLRGMGCRRRRPRRPAAVGPIRGPPRRSAHGAEPDQLPRIAPITGGTKRLTLPTWIAKGTRGAEPRCQLPATNRAATHCLRAPHGARAPVWTHGHCYLLVISSDRPRAAPVATAFSARRTARNTCAGPHRRPRAERMPRVFSASAMPRRLVVPSAAIAAITDAISVAKASARAACTAFARVRPISLACCIRWERAQSRICLSSSALLAISRPSGPSTHLGNSMWVNGVAGGWRPSIPLRPT